MKKNLLLLLLFICYLPAHSQSWQWVNSGGSVFQDHPSFNEEVSSIALDSLGNSYVTGWIHQSPSFGNGWMTSYGGDDIFVAKYDCEGVMQWIKLFGGTGNEEGVSIKVDNNGNSYLLAGSNGASITFGSQQFSRPTSNFMFVKLDPNGDPVWIKDGGNLLSASTENTLEFDRNGDLLLTVMAFEDGLFNGFPVQRGNFVAKYTTAGTLLWAKNADTAYGTSQYPKRPTYRSLAIDIQNNIYLAGHFNDTVIVGGQQINSYNPYVSNLLLVKLNSAGDFLWLKEGESQQDNYTSVKVDPQGNIYTTGAYGNPGIFGQFTITNSGTNTLGGTFLAKLDSLGNYLWISSPTTQYGFGMGVLSLDQEKNSYVTGRRIGPADFGNGNTLGSNLGLNDVFVVKYDSLGIAQLAIDLPGHGDLDYGAATAISEQGSLYLGGGFHQTLMGGPDTVSAVGGNTDVFVAKFGNSCSDPALLVPYAPTQLAVTAPASQMALQLSWADGSTTETGYRIYRSTTSGQWQLIDSVSANITTYLDEAVQANTYYCYKVAAFNQKGNSAFTNSDCEEIIIVSPPAAPVQLAVTASASQAALELTWQDAATTEDGFYIYRNTASGAWDLIDSTTANTTFYVDGTVQNNTLYCYRVAAFNTIGSSANSNEACEELLMGIEENLALQQLQLYPNPSNGNFTIAAHAAEPTEATCIISSITGQQLLQQRLRLQPGDNLLPVALPVVAKGLYLVQVQSKDGVITRRLVVE